MGVYSLLEEVYRYSLESYENDVILGSKRERKKELTQQEEGKWEEIYKNHKSSKKCRRLVVSIC